MPRALFLLFFLAVMPLFARLAGSDENHDYIFRLRQAVGEWRQDVPALDASAAQAAKSLVGGGHLYVGGSQQSFIEEALARSGGLILSLGLTDSLQLQANDVILFAAIHGDNPKALDALRPRVKSAGAQLIIFSSSNRPADAHLTLFPVHPVPDTNLPSVESTSNVAGLWAWTGQLIEQCVALGKTPCIYESMFMPGGLARDKAIQTSSFHPLNLSYGPKFPALGRNYLQSLDTSLAHLAEKNAGAFRLAASLLVHTHADHHPVMVFSIGHMFPAEFTSNPVPSWIVPAPANAVPAVDTLFLYLGYQWFPWEFPGLMGPNRLPSIIATSRHPTLDWQADETHIYLDPCWEVQDATVAIPGYDIKALPASGVLESAIFWELVERLPQSALVP